MVEFNGNTTSRLQFVIFGKILTPENPYAESNIESSEIFNIDLLNYQEKLLKKANDQNGL